MNDSTLITISWDTTTETHTVAALREKFASTNLFHEDGTWELTAPAAKSYILTMASLEDVLDLLEARDEWTCDNCTVSLAEVITHDEQEMSQGYHGPSFKPVAIPCRFCGAEDTSGECDECTEKLDFSESENVLPDHDWNDMDDDADMLDSIISMLDGMDADRMASYLMGVQDALNGCVVAKLDNQNERDGDYLAGHKRAQGGAQ